MPKSHDDDIDITKRSRQPKKDWAKFKEEEDFDSTDAEPPHPETTKATPGTGHLDEQAILENPTYQKLGEQLNEAEQLVNKYKNDFLRSQADLENLNRRFAKDLENAHKYGIEKFALALLPVVDSLETSLKNLIGFNDPTQEQQKVTEGLALTLKMFLGVLVKFDIEQLDPKGKPFDPLFHEAVSLQESTGVAPNHVMTVLQKGYLLQGRLVRPAMVIVAKGDS